MKVAFVRLYRMFMPFLMIQSIPNTGSAPVLLAPPVQSDPTSSPTIYLSMRHVELEPKSACIPIHASPVQTTQTNRSGAISFFWRVRRYVRVCSANLWYD